MTSHPGNRAKTREEQQRVDAAKLRRINEVTAEILAGMDCVHPAAFEKHIRAVLTREFIPRPGKKQSPVRTPGETIRRRGNDLETLRDAVRIRDWEEQCVAGMICWFCTSPAVATLVEPSSELVWRDGGYDREMVHRPVCGPGQCEYGYGP